MKSTISTALMFATLLAGLLPALIAGAKRPAVKPIPIERDRNRYE